MDSYVKKIRSLVGNTEKIILHACAVIITNENNEILLQQRADTLKWGLPGGLKELNETLLECAKREVKEETNLDVKILKLQGIYTNPDMSWFGYDHAEVICTMFIGKASGEIKCDNEEGVALKYFKKEDLPVIHSVDNFEAITDYFNNRHNVVDGRIL